MTDTDIAQNTEQSPHHRTVKSFVIRAGRMTAGQQKGLDEYWPTWGLTLEQGKLDIEQAFGRQAETVLEIGFGMGLSLLSMAQAAPQNNFIGIEVHRPGVGSLLNEAGKAGVNNIRVYCHDAVEILRECIADESLDRVQIYFPDPWHKKRHNKRRLIQPAFVEALRPKLKQGGILHLATDWENYAEQMMEVMSAAEGWNNLAGDNQYSPRPDYRPLTKFEKRGQKLGHGVWDLLFERTK
ncbi:MAG: tRNA (guanosine(46)-N7)-methyltransferase TrmB [Oceanospirillales bacterium LUC14_002_19_P2]|nr:MAG: tRNA (guanosine(46)-N7)-methyltransferase TrmB [Oceanospirillales bacterium LUC14_002_19_P2]